MKAPEAEKTATIVFFQYTDKNRLYLFRRQTISEAIIVAAGTTASPLKCFDES